jgi:hypothetical protein
LLAHTSRNLFRHTRLLAAVIVDGLDRYPFLAA